jgi:hypothetical protein
VRWCVPDRRGGAWIGTFSREDFRFDEEQNIYICPAGIKLTFLDIREWNSSNERAFVLMPGFLHMTILEPLAIDNPRVLPQQSISSVTNIDDLETYLNLAEQRSAKMYLQAIDLPARGRATVMHELALMGITAGSLFPGLDGACLQLALF